MILRFQLTNWRKRFRKIVGVAQQQEAVACPVTHRGGLRRAWGQTLFSVFGLGSVDGDAPLVNSSPRRFSEHPLEVTKFSAEKHRGHPDYPTPL
jgi:hypothetical protein